MKNPIRFGFLPALLPGCLLPLLALLLAACFNPITVIPPKQNDLNVDPFTIDILIGNDGSARSIAGPDSTRIKGDIRNFMQLIVVDNTGNIVALAEARREDDDDTDGLLSINSIAFGPTYHFLLLMGHWNRDYEKETGGTGTYKYKYTSDSPTLLAAGLLAEQLVTGSGTVTITMWPIVVDTVFITLGGPPIEPEVDKGFTSGDQTTEPVEPQEPAAWKPKEVTLHPVAWDVTWTIKRGLTGNGLTDLVNAQNIIPANDENPLALKSITTLVKVGTEVQEKSEKDVELSRTKNVITQSLKDYTKGFGHIGERGSVNFRLEYVPFNLTGEGENPWTEFKSVFNLSGNNVPVWIIRNGINDEAQDGDTDFTAFHNIKNPGTGTPNGNGAVRYTIDVRPPDDKSTLKISNGVFVGPSNSMKPEIGFTTSGYAGKAEVYYAVVPHTDASSPPGYSAYTKNNLDPVAATDIPHKGQITLLENQVGKDYDVYVIIYKDGEVSVPEVINTLRGGVVVVPEWEDGSDALQW
ncbi:MAG: hypothetical protein LBB98_12450 [Treponema sp.]|nr:hypothetical protein [Treponema sp.]